MPCLSVLQKHMICQETLGSDISIEHVVRLITEKEIAFPQQIVMTCLEQYCYHALTVFVWINISLKRVLFSVYCPRHKCFHALMVSCCI